ncbi:Protein sof1 [Colletotrichum chlorophyti]|uniref:DDB1- and CUL4-associated factor 13 n=1 Tax=Colletotrichum chlorophyti TaxID=708187 RepID=A0A1Q8RYQ4_9PEZI|nr:Protein sof1 [Colletotrichum chlorophyti]
MKIKAISRSVEAYQPPGANAQKLPRILWNALASMLPSPLVESQADEFLRYTKALNAVKLERMHAAPFIGQVGSGHVDGVYSMAKDPNSLKNFASGSGDGAIKALDLTTRDEIWSTKNAHTNIVRSLSWTKDQKLLSAAADKTIKLWDPYNTPSDSAPLSSWLGSSGFQSLSHHRSRNAFAASSSSSEIAIYDLERHSAAPEVLRWPNATDTISSVAFNQVEQSILGSTGADRSIILWDIRTSMPLTKTTMTFACNSLSWNPMEAFNFVVGSEDHNCYMFDMRKFDRALNVFKGHVAAVMSVEFSPTGEELVSGSYDRTVRIWNRDQGHSRDMYHTKRMQRVFSTMFTPDSKYILSGSDDGNVRIWRSNATERSGIRSAKQRQALEYNDALVNRYSHMPEIRRIKRHRHLPKVIKKAGEIKNEELKSIKRREENERRHTKKQFERRKGEREKPILAREK